MVAKHFKIIVLALSICSCVSCAFLQKNFARHTYRKQPLQSAFLSRLEGDRVGYLFIDAVTGKEIASYQADVYFTPASLTKLASAYAALKYIGDSLTRFAYAIEGDTLFIRPYGDPTWYDTSYEKSFVFFDNIEKRRDSLSHFRVVFPERKIEPYPMGWSWEDVNKLFFQALSPMPLNRNECTIWSDSSGITTYPAYIGKRASCCSTEHTSSTIRPIFRDFFSNRIFYKKDTSPICSVYKLPLYGADQQDMVALLSEYSGKPFELAQERSSAPHEWVEYKSQPVKTVLKKMLANSDNFAAQQLLLQSMLKSIAYPRIDSMYAFLRRNDWQDIPQPLYWADGSGLSRYNAATAQTLVYILQKIIETKKDMSILREILPTIGEGTLRINGWDALTNRLFAKTGSMRGVFCLAGILYPKKKNPALFCVMINGKPSHSIDALKEGLLYLYNN